MAGQFTSGCTDKRAASASQQACADAASGPPDRLRAGDPIPPDFDLPPSRAPVPLLADFWRDHGARLRRFFLSRASRQDADDLVQDTFVRLASMTSHKAALIRQPRAYANRVAENLVREQARFAARRSAALHCSDEDVQLAGPDPVVLLESRDMLARLEAAMARMTPATREIFMAYRLDGYTYREIADRTGHSIKCVEKHIAKAIVVVNRAMRTR